MAPKIIAATKTFA